MHLVVDASLAVEYLLRTALGRRIAERIERDDLIAPALLDAEVLAVVRRAWLAKRLTEARAAEALDDLLAWNVRRIPLDVLVEEAWSFRRNVGGYDAFYLAAARLAEAALLTTDGPLARAPKTGVVIETVRI
jgi:predicted nucleic acid-binding protein